MKNRRVHLTLNGIDVGKTICNPGAFWKYRCDSIPIKTTQNLVQITCGNCLQILKRRGEKSVEYIDYYEYKGERYSFENNVVFKHPDTREWIDAVLYCNYEGTDYYVREEKDFKAKFKPIIRRE